MSYALSRFIVSLTRHQRILVDAFQLGLLAHAAKITASGTRDSGLASGLDTRIRGSVDWPRRPKVSTPFTVLDTLLLEEQRGKSRGDEMDDD